MVMKALRPLVHQGEVPPALNMSEAVLDQLAKEHTEEGGAKKVENEDDPVGGWHGVMMAGYFTR